MRRTIRLPIETANIPLAVARSASGFAAITFGSRNGHLISDTGKLPYTLGWLV